MTPYYLAFPMGFIGVPYFMDTTINIIFAIDVISNFFLAYYDEDYQIVDNMPVV